MCEKKIVKKTKMFPEGSFRKQKKFKTFLLKNKLLGITLQYVVKRYLPFSSSNERREENNPCMQAMSKRSRLKIVV